MARSKYIYLIEYEKCVDSVFTVKYEMESYLDGKEYLHDGYTRIFRFPDGRRSDGIEITNEYFE
jgi:hypothetical protein